MADKETNKYGQYVLNKVHDTDFDVLKVIPYGYTGSSAVALKVDASGNLTLVKGYPATAYSATISSADATSATQVKAGAGTGVYIYITDIICSTDTATDLQIQDDEGTPNVLIENIHLAANGGFVANFATPIKQPVANADIDVIAGDAGNISVTINGFTTT